MIRRHRTFHCLIALLAAVVAAVPPAGAQEEIDVTIDPSKAAGLVRISVPFPTLAPGVAAVQVRLAAELEKELARLGAPVTFEARVLPSLPAASKAEMR